MKKLFLLCTAFIAFTLISSAQSSKTYAITSQGAGNYYWGNIKEVDLATGKVLQSIFESDKTPYQIFDANSKKELNTEARGLSINYNDKPFAMGVAASAYDKKHNRLYFTPMHTAQIRYIDLNSNEAKFFYLQDKMIDNPSGYLTEENHITRMVLIGKVGYAITNDGNHLFQFTTNKNASVTDLGALIDDASNGSISVHNKCSSWGGDIVATNEGMLYLITANRHVFTVDVASKVAKYVGAIKGIPGQFTTNGAVVNDAGKIVVTSANAASGFYAVDINSLDATIMDATATNVSISDLANANLIESKKPAAYTETEMKKITPALISNDNISVYPNPIRTPQFKINFDEMANGNYLIAVTDLMGRQVFNKRVVIQNEGQVETINMQKKPSAGIYMVRVSDPNNKDVFAGKLIVE
jgi:hypothetical protein